MNAGTSGVVWIDTETTGLSSTDQVWEVAAVRGNEVLHLFVEHDARRAAWLPDSFREDYEDRFPGNGARGVLSRVDAARAIKNFLVPTPESALPVLGGVNVAFDATMVRRLIDHELLGEPELWSHHLLEVVPFVAGTLVSRGQFVSLPFSSLETSSAVGVNPDDFDRHTALGDALWAREIFESAMGLARLGRSQ